MLMGKGSVTASTEIPTASMADIAFLLLIFFMVTTIFGSTKASQKINAPVVVAIANTGYISALLIA